MTKEEWEELKWRAVKVKDNPQFQKAINQISPRANKLKGNLHFATTSTYSKRNKAKGISFRIRHNERKEEQEPSYLLPESEREPNEFQAMKEQTKEFLKSQNLSPDYESFLKAYEQKIKDDYKKHHNQRMQDKAQPLKEAVLNLEKHHTINDIRKALKESNFPLQAAHIAIHRDEGYKHELTGETIKNYHAHIIFVNYDFDKHRTILRDIRKADFCKSKERLIKALGMEINAEKKAKKHLSRYQLQYKKEKIAHKLLIDLREFEKKQEKTPQEKMLEQVRNLSNFNQKEQGHTKTLKNNLER